MERSRKNKENICNNARITSMFKVKKCLFEQTVQCKSTESSSLDSGQQCLMASPVTQALVPDDSPFSLFKCKKKNVLRTKSTNCREYTLQGSIVTTPTNNKYSKTEVNEKEDICDSIEMQSPSNVKLAVQKSILNPNLIGDFTKPCALPTIRGRHPDLITISPETVASLLQGMESSSFSLIDCRYPYEFNAGHIKSACNIYTKEDISKNLLSISNTKERKESQEILIFYCEFSSERGPTMLRHLRSIDRDLNRDCYPSLYYPELYVMGGGYKEFFSTYKELCDPQQYKTMLDKDCTEELAYFRSKCKSLSRRSKCKRARSSLNF